MKKIFLITATLILNYFLKGQTFTLNLQPTSGAGIDANVQSNNPTLNLGSEDVLRFSRSTTGVKERSFLQFDIHSLPAGVDIISAKLILYGVNHTIVNSGNGILQLVPDTWSENTVNWNISTTLKNSSMPTVSIPSATSVAQNYTLDVKEMVQTMVNTPLVNFGWLLAMENENASNNKTYRFGSSDNSNASLCPKLSITYCNHMTVNAFVGPATGTTTSDAGVVLNVTDGVPPYTYLWSNGATTKDIYNVAPGLYTVTITDNRGTPVSKIIPVAGSCGSLSFTVLYSAGGFSNARLINESFNSNTANSNFVNTTLLRANNISSGGGNVITRSLMAFDLNALPNNVQVNQANLILTDDEVTQASTFKVQLRRINDNWNQRTVTYNEQPSFNTSSQDLIDFNYDGSQSSYNIDVTTHLQTMIGQVNSSLGWVLKLEDESPTDAGISASFKNPQIALQLTMPSFACDDNLLNWNLEETYDENGNIISSEKSYLDNLGRLTQKLVKNASNEVFRTQTVYDSYGFAAVNSLPAYSGNQLKYQTNFMLNQSGQAYSYTDFDSPGTLNNNTALQNGVSNSLGNYYSNTNPYDSYQAIADNPFTRTETTGAGSKTRVSKPGNAFKMGSGKETISFSMISGDELKYIFGTTGSNYYSYKVTQSSTNVMDYNAIQVTEYIKATKKIVITPDNPETVTYSIGDKLIASCYSGLSTGESYSTISGVTNLMLYKGLKCTDIHLPYANRTSLSLPLPLSIPGNSSSAPSLSDISYSITDLHRDVKLNNGTDYTIGSNQVVTFSTAFLNLYLNKSMCLRISYSYSNSYQTYLTTNSLTPEDAKVVYDLKYGRASKNYYDLSGTLRKSVSPKGFDITNPNVSTMATSYDYSHLGQLIGVKSPDEGYTQMIYNKEGNLRFSQNEKQKNSNYFSYINYDKHGRAYENGENHTARANGSSVSFVNYYGQGNFISPGIFSSIIVDQQDGLSSSEKTNKTVTSYIAPAAGSSGDIPAAYSYISQYRNFRNGLVNSIKNDNSTIWYNYDKLGRKLATITQITEPDFVSKNSNLDDRIKTSESTFDYYTGLSTSSTYQLNASNEYLKYQFSYDANLRPSASQLTYGGNTYNLNANTYNKMGQLKRVVIGNNYQGLDYVYTLNGGLKAINHPGLDPSLDPGGDVGTYGGSNNNVNMDLFGEIIEFYQNDYERNNTNINSSISSNSSVYDGLIYATRFKTRDQVNSRNTGANTINDPINPITLINNTNYKQQELRFEYTYDEFNQLGGTIFETYNNSSNAITQRSEYSENGNTGFNITYDRNGNINRLTRKAYNNTTLDDLTYTYGTTDNKLTAIVDAAVNSYNTTFNFKTPSNSSTSPFSYNAIGQMTASPAEGISTIDYFPNGKIKKVTFANSNTCEYEYGAMGEKLKSKYYNYSNGKYKYTWYVGPYIYECDQAGANTFQIKEAKITGGVIRVGASSVNSGYIVYHITDHLGNVRASFTKKDPANFGNVSGTGIEILSYSDYYAFGGQLPGRNYVYENYRYGYQGQEKSEDGTIWDQFELRNYNHDLGRWFAPDPYGQFTSPYIAMSNNPVSNVDPDGGQSFQITGNSGRLLGYRQDKWDRGNQTGAYSSEAVQKRYDDEYENLKQNYLLNNPNRIRDSKGFTDAVLAMNGYYMGLGHGSGGTAASIGFASGNQELTQTEIGLNIGACQLAGNQAQGGNFSEFKQAAVANAGVEGESAETYAKRKRETIRPAVIAWTAVNSIMDQNGNNTGRVAVTTHHLDGSETIVEYDTKGEPRADGSPAIDHISFLDKSQVDARNNRAAGTSHDTRTWSDAGGGFVGPAQSNSGAQSGGGNIWNNVANGLGIGMGVQQEVLGYAVAQNYKSARNPWAFTSLRETQQAWRTTNTLGKVGKGLLTATKVLGVTAGVIQIGVKGAEIYDKGFQNATVRDWTDISVNTAGVIATVFFASNPIGWAVGAAALAYSVGTTIYDASTKP